jgi:hypothetical protein
MPFVGSEDQFEDAYVGKFRATAAPHGLIIKYEKDLAAIDIGLHFYDPKAAGKSSSPLGSRRAWFQLKGKHEQTLSASDLATAQTVAVGKIKLESLRFWYAQPEPVYLTVYLEATDEFLVEDVQTIVDRQWGLDFLKGGTFKPGQNEVTLHVTRAAVLADQTWIDMKSAAPMMRVDGPQWRGRPLGHRLDPLRSALAPMLPADYRLLVDRLLEVHGYEIQDEIDTNGLYDEADAEAQAALTIGRLHYTYEGSTPVKPFGSKVIRCLRRALSRSWCTMVRACRISSAWQRSPLAYMNAASTNFWPLLTRPVGAKRLGPTSLELSRSSAYRKTCRVSPSTC